jgi:hypothetical protein
MRYHEFMVEHKKGKISRRLQNATVGLHTFIDNEHMDRTYELNRIMMAAAMADGTDNPIDIDSESWAGRNDIAAPYTEIEDRMMHQAFKAVGSEHRDLNRGDTRSQEHPDVYTASPIKAFKGYPR